MRGWFAIALPRRPLPISQHYRFPCATTRTMVVGLGGDDSPSTIHSTDYGSLLLANFQLLRNHQREKIIAKCFKAQQRSCDEI